MTEEQAKNLLNAIFAEPETEDEPDDDYPATAIEKVGYAEYVLAADLEHIGKVIIRLSRLNRLFVVAGKDENGLPPIILHNELRMALEPLLRVRDGIDEITEMLMEVYKETKMGDKKEGAE